MDQHLTESQSRSVRVKCTHRITCFFSCFCLDVDICSLYVFSSTSNAVMNRMSSRCSQCTHSVVHNLGEETKFVMHKWKHIQQLELQNRNKRLSIVDNFNSKIVRGIKWNCNKGFWIRWRDLNLEVVYALTVSRGRELHKSTTRLKMILVADLCSNYYLASRLPYAMYANRSC